MRLEAKVVLASYNHWICPDLTAYWLLGAVKNSNQIVLQSKAGNQRHCFSATEGYALQHFTGGFTLAQVTAKCQQKFGETLPGDWGVSLLQKLVVKGILVLESEEVESEEREQFQSTFNSHCTTRPTPRSKLQLKPGLQWIEHPEGYWILRNPVDVTFLQISIRDREIIQQLGELSPAGVAQKFQISLPEIHHLLRLLAATGMLVGTVPAPASKRKFTPMQLLFFRVPLFNPDAWLSQQIQAISWVFSRPFSWILGVLLVWAAVVGLSQRASILHAGQLLWLHQGASLILPLAFLTLFVVTLHELGHAFTLKHFGGIVPEVGVFFMLGIPAAYTNTTDSYCLVKRFQRGLVVAAGVIVQLAIAAVALLLWNLSAVGTWLHLTSYLLMVAALLTIALNLNPLSKFDGYYLAVALTGINNLRARSLQFYANLLKGKPITEKGSVCAILAAYAPLSLAYVLLVFGFLLARILEWTLTHIPTTAICLLALWAIYFYFPAAASGRKS
ncbi:MAG: hypothetical protein F6K32_19170 [Desertifilum sp. SIO1I2]|nr:hypothetical protein [Desertifilum sp. SIO1I2]